MHWLKILRKIQMVAIVETAIKPIAAVRFRHLKHCFWLSPLLVMGLGCREAASTRSSQSSVTQLIASSASIAADATPIDVARVALKAIASKDKETLKGLLAVKKIAQDVEAISRGHAKFQGLVDSAIPTAVGAISSEINWLDVEGRVIDQESITGTTALVTVKGKRAGQEQTRRLFLVQEDSQWRLVPSHR